MQRLTAIVAIYFIRGINKVLGKKRSRLNGMLSSFLCRSDQVLQVTTADGLKWKIRTASYIDCLIASDGLEPSILKLLQSQDLVGKWVVDMGANVGGLTLRFAKAVGESGRIIAYEPNPIVAKQLRENVDLNKLGNVHVLQMGVWSEAGSFTLFLPSHGNSGTASMIDKKSNAGGEEVQVFTETFDSRWSALGRPPIRFVKMDIQGAEMHALRGMHQMLRVCKPDLIIEITGLSANLPHQTSAIAQALAADGYNNAQYLGANGATEIAVFAELIAGKQDNLSGDILFTVT